ncbi:dihydropyrimidinase [Flagelloscypha sp. PMI_526]|nr:dihydropyrimidinase [Flagelloscypha sp. PMI_526]
MSQGLDCIVHNAVVVTASDVYPCDIGIAKGKIVTLAEKLVPGSNCRTIDAEGGFVTPGGVDSHVHIAQESSSGSRSADDWNSASRSALAGGTTTVIAFAVQSRNGSMKKAVQDYHRLAGSSRCDYGFHVIVTNPSDEQMNTELPDLVKAGITSIKIYMTYQSYKLNDGQILDVLVAARRLGVTTMCHCENADVVEWMTKSLELKGMTEPWHHGTSRPPIVEAEATNRALTLAELMDAPILIVHVSAPDAVRVIRSAQTRLLPVYAETCPHYALLDGSRMRTKTFEGAKCVCSPPLRDDPTDQAAIWEGLANGTFTVFSSDHAPTCYDDERGKKMGLVKAPEKPLGNFKYIPNGLPGVETRVPLLWSEGVLKGRLSPQRFVELTATNPAKLYGLYPQKGTIQPGSDADLIIWRSKNKRVPHVVSNDKLHHDVDYTPFEGFELKDWPRYTMLRGQIVYDGDTNQVSGAKGFGKFLKRTSSVLPGPRNVWLSDWRP